MKRLFLLLLLAVPAFGQLSSSGSITITGATCATTNACVAIGVASNVSTVNITLSGTFTGTFSFESSSDGGNNYVALSCSPIPSGSNVTSATATGQWTCVTTGMTNVRVRASAAVTGAAVTTLTASTAMTAFGAISATQNISTCSSCSFIVTTRSRWISPADGIWTATPNAGNNNAFTRLQFGGTTSSFPGLCISGTVVTNCLADGTTAAISGLGTTTVGALPAAAAGNKGQMISVSDSTTVSAEGQTCVGGSSNTALAFSNGTVWKCF